MLVPAFLSKYPVCVCASALPPALGCQQQARNHCLVLCLTRVIRCLNLCLLLIKRWQMPDA